MDTLAPAILKDLVVIIDEIATSFQTEEETFPVLGAAGNEFFVELSSGKFSTRTIHKTIYVTMGEQLDQATLEELGMNESQLSIPDAKYLLALLGLLQAHCKQSLVLCHPLTASGNYLTGWTQASNFISSRTGAPYEYGQDFSELE